MSHEHAALRQYEERRARSHVHARVQADLGGRRSNGDVRPQNTNRDRRDDERTVLVAGHRPYRAMPLNDLIDALLAIAGDRHELGVVTEDPVVGVPVVPVERFVVLPNDAPNRVLSVRTLWPRWVRLN